MALTLRTASPFSTPWSLPNVQYALLSFALRIFRLDSILSAFKFFFFIYFFLNLSLVFSTSHQRLSEVSLCPFYFLIFGFHLFLICFQALLVVICNSALFQKQSFNFSSICCFPNDHWRKSLHFCPDHFSCDLIFMTNERI